VGSHSIETGLKVGEHIATNPPQVNTRCAARGRLFGDPEQKQQSSRKVAKPQRRIPKESRKGGRQEKSREREKDGVTVLCLVLFLVSSFLPSLEGLLCGFAPLREVFFGSGRSRSPLASFARFALSGGAGGR
jgi:hypothetical protein